ncbi:MAG: signal peptidase I [Bacteroidota bacterium]
MRTVRRTVLDGAIILCAALLFAAGLKSCIIDAYKIPTASMESTLHIGDYVLVNKFIFGARTPEKFLYIPIPHFRFPALRSIHRGDVIVFEFPGEPNEVIMVRNLFLVKRCVGLPGDTVDVTEGNVRVNGLRADFFERAKEDFSPVTVPYQGMKIVMNERTFNQWKIFIRREGSTAEFLNGSVVIDGQQTDSYTVKRNYYFAFGDNINNSADSRVWGFVPEENIVGKAMMVYFSKNEQGVQWSRIGTIVK